MINARSESLGEKPAFRDAFARRRCLVPASGFYEWKRSGALRQPYYVRPAAAALFAFAGLWDEETFAVITTEANTTLGAIHDRMPVILAPEDYGAWLDPRSEASALLRPYPAERMRVREVSPRVNRPEHDDPALIEAITAPTG